MTEKTKKTLRIIGYITAGAALGTIITLAVVNNPGSSQVNEEIARLKKIISQLEVEKRDLDRQNTRLNKRLEAVLYYLGRVVAQYEVKTNQK